MYIHITNTLPSLDIYFYYTYCSACCCMTRWCILCISSNPPDITTRSDLSPSACLSTSSSSDTIHFHNPSLLGKSITATLPVIFHFEYVLMIVFLTWIFYIGGGHQLYADMFHECLHCRPYGFMLSIQYRIFGFLSHVVWSSNSIRWSRIVLIVLITDALLRFQIIRVLFCSVWLTWSYSEDVKWDGSQNCFVVLVYTLE